MHTTSFIHSFRDR